MNFATADKLCILFFADFYIRKIYIYIYIFFLIDIKYFYIWYFDHEYV